VYHEGPATFNQEQNVVYFTRSNYLKRKKLGKNSDNINNLKIFRAELLDSVWTNLEELPFNSDDYSCGHPSLSEDGRSLYFVSDMPGGSGGTDIYVCILSPDGSNWLTPKNLGPVINTTGNEMFPYFHGVDSLYFASESHNTLGGLDVFFSLKTNKGWSMPTNLNYPLNSSKDDFGFFLDNETHKSGYVSSNRAGEDAVYHFNINDPTLMLRGVVTIKGKGTPIKNAIVTLYNQIDTLVIMTDEKGSYSTRLHLNTNYKIAASKENYLTQSALLSTVGQKVSMEYIRNFELEEIVIQKPIIIPNIYYDFDKWAIRPDAAIELDKIVTLLNDNPKIRIEMGSHTDCRGSYKYNDVLSGKRAKSAVEYLISKGIDASRLEYHGYGERVLVNDCACEPNRVGAGADCTKEQHQENRRTEFKVIEVLN
jgi:outer membrane protein OmpA-like peptidoglycan-associated protein